VTVDGEREQAVLFIGARQVPRPRRVRGEAEEAAIIFGIADHHQRTVGHRPRRFEHAVHQRAAVAAALNIGAHRNRADHHQRRCRPLRIAMRDRPALDRADQRAILDSGEAEAGDRIHALADAIGGSSKAVRSESGVEERLDCLRFDFGQWK